MGGAILDYPVVDGELGKMGTWAEKSRTILVGEQCASIMLALGLKWRPTSRGGVPHHSASQGIWRDMPWLMI